MFSTIWRRKLKSTKITQRVQKRASRSPTLRIRRTEETTNSNRSAYAIKIFLTLSGFNAAINKNVEGRIGIIWSVQASKTKI